MTDKQEQKPELKPEHEPEHKPEQQRFCLGDGGQQAELTYIMVNDSTINFTRTYVPEALRGQGIAEHLVRAGLNWAKDRNYDIVADCWYVEKFLR